MSDTNFSLIDFKALSEPAGKLIDAVRSAVGILYEPTQLRRKAHADADAAVILARNHNDIKDIEFRASERLRNKELRRQQNIEDVTRAGLAALPPAVDKDRVDHDWVHEFYEHCQDVGNAQMQQLWGKILAGEVAKPGTYSLRCLRVIKDIQQKDADTFTRFCTFVWAAPGQGLVPIILDRDAPNIKEANVAFTDFLHLEDMGLIQFGQVTGFSMDQVKGKTLILAYYGQPHRIRVPETLEKLEIGCALLTSVGAELAPIAGSRPSEPYRRSIVDRWRADGCIIEELPK